MMHTHSLITGPPVFTFNMLIISLPFIRGFTSHTFSRPAPQEEETQHEWLKQSVTTY